MKRFVAAVLTLNVAVPSTALAQTKSDEIAIAMFHRPSAMLGIDTMAMRSRRSWPMTWIRDGGRNVAAWPTGF